MIVGGQRVAVRARLPEGDDAENAYRAMAEVSSVYAEYKTRTDRAIRVFLLTRVSSD